GVDHRAGAAGDGDVIVGQVDVDRLDRIHRHRLAHGRQVVGLQAERVVGAHAVDADGVEAGVLAAGRDLAAALVGLGQARVEAHIVLDVALDRRQGLDLGVADAGAGAHLVGAEDVGTDVGAGGDHGDEGGEVAGEAGIDLVDLVQRQIDVVLGGGARARLADVDGVRAAHAQAAGVVAAAGVGGDPADRAGLDVHDRHLGAGNRLPTGVKDGTAD